MSGLLRFSHNWRWKMQIFRFSQNFFPWNWNAGQVLEEHAQIHPLQMSSAFQHSPAYKGRPVGPSLLYLQAAVWNAVGARFTCICPLSVSYQCDTVKPLLSAPSLQHWASHFSGYLDVTFKLQCQKSRRLLEAEGLDGFWGAMGRENMLYSLVHRQTQDAHTHTDRYTDL